MSFIETINCNQYKKAIYKAIAYLDNEKKKEQIENAIEKVNYSGALADALEEVNKLLDTQYKSKSKDSK